MDRRTFNQSLAAAVLAPLMADPVLAAGPSLQIGMLLYPGMYALDLVGPYAFLAGLPNVETHLLWKTLDPVPTINGMRLVPTGLVSACPRQLDVLFVPGGTPGTIALMQDNEVLDFLADRGERARYITSVCTGSLLLGAAGLLRGYKATSHWHKRDLLPLFGAVPVPDRIVEVDLEPALSIRDEKQDWRGETFLCLSVLAHADMGSLRMFRVRHPIEMEAADLPTYGTVLCRILLVNKLLG